MDQEILKVDFGAIKKNQTADVLLKPYDVIDVSENGSYPRQCDRHSRWHIPGRSATLCTVADTVNVVTGDSPRNS